MAVNHLHSHALFQIPNQNLFRKQQNITIVLSFRSSSGCLGYLAVVSGAEQDSAAGGMPLNKPRPPAVANQDHQSFCHVSSQTAIRNLPDSHLEFKGQGKFYFSII